MPENTKLALGVTGLGVIQLSSETLRQLPAPTKICHFPAALTLQLFVWMNDSANAEIMGSYEVCEAHRPELP